MFGLLFGLMIGIVLNSFGFHWLLVGPGYKNRWQKAADDAISRNEEANKNNSNPQEPNDGIKKNIVIEIPSLQLENQTTADETPTKSEDGENKVENYDILARDTFIEEE